MIGDFWGANSSDVFWNANGVSSILVHTQKGDNFLKSVEDIDLFPTTFERIVEKNKNIIEPRSATPITEKFTKLFVNHNLFYSVRHSRAIKTRIKRFIKYFLPKSLITKLKNIK